MSHGQNVEECLGGELEVGQRDGDLCAGDQHDEQHQRQEPEEVIEPRGPPGSGGGGWLEGSGGGGGVQGWAGGWRVEGVGVFRVGRGAGRRNQWI